MKANRRSLFRGMVLSALMAASVGFVSEAMADTFVCTPKFVGVFSDRVHVLCTASTGGGIRYFAVCNAGNSAAAARMLSVFTTAKVTVKNLQIYFNPADTSGTACSCLAGDCRLAMGAEVLQ